MKIKKGFLGLVTVFMCTLVSVPVIGTTPADKVQAKSTIQTVSAANNKIQQLSKKKRIGKKKAKSIALKKVPRAKVIKCVLDYDDGIWKYEVELHKGSYEYDLEIDAYTGTILDYDKDSIYD